MDIFNSQTLSHFDGYYHRFALVGDYTWGIMQKQSYVIHVKSAPSGHQPTQHVISLTFQNGSFVVDPASKDIAIFTNDHVLWHNDTPDPGIPPFSIVGDNGLPAPSNDAFNSRRLGSEDAFSHLFMLAGTYSYLISGGSGGARQGTIPVLVNGSGAAGSAVVSVKDGQPPSPDPVTKQDGTSIFVGDTILWDIDSGSAITIKNL